MAEAVKTIEVLQEEVKGLKETVVEHRTRLENGSTVFEGWNKRIAEVEERTKPKPPPSVLKVAGITLTVVLAGATALWGLANMMRDRPTTHQIDDIVEKHGEVGHKETRDKIHEIRLEQRTQRTLIEGIQKVQQKQDEKLDQLLERAPKAARPR